MSGATPEVLDTVFKKIDSSKDALIARLVEAVAIPSVSAEAAHRPDVKRMCEWTKQRLEALGATVELGDLGEQKTETGAIPLPPVVIGRLGSDPKKKTLLVYGHLDVQPAYKSDGWHTDPFTLTEKDGKLYGRGSTDDKGPVICWLNAIEALQSQNVTIPVNIKFCFEGMEESGSVGLPEYLKKNKDTFLKDVDFTCISDNYWLGKKKPAITYGLRGICYFFLEVEGPKLDLHSGCFGGTVHEPLQDVMHIMSQLVHPDGKIAIPGLYDMVGSMSDNEREQYEKMDFEVEEYKTDTGAHLFTEKKVEVLARRMREPSLSLHGVEGAFSSSGAKTVIPSKVIGKFSIRLVPDMQPDKVEELVKKHVEDLWKKRGSPNKYKVSNHHGAPAWLGDTESPNFKAAHRAIKKVFGVDPDYTREGGSIPITLTFQELTGKSVILLPIGAADDMPHAQNEKINVSNYMQGAKMLASYLLELADS